MPTLIQLEVFMLILARISGMMVRAPVISDRGTPAIARMALAIFLSVILWFIIPLPPRLPALGILFMVALVNEVIFGVLISFVAFLATSLFQSAGEIMDLQMGLSISKTLDPAFGTEISLVGRLTYMYGLLLFLLVNGHHLMLSALNTSFSLFPLAGVFNYSQGFLQQMIGFVSALWLLSIQLAAPVVLMIFLADFSFGMISRVAPQVNVFQLGFQIKPLLGIFVFLAVLPLFTNRLITLIYQLLPQYLTLFGLMLR